MVKRYNDLVVWQKSMDLVVEIYRIVKLLPKEEVYALSAQMRRAAISIPSNIAEGQSRNTSKEFINFLGIARGSNAELQTQCLLCVKLEYLTEKDIACALSLTNEIGKMLNALILTLSASS